LDDDVAVDGALFVLLFVVATANIARRLADDNGISMPVTAAVAAVLAGSLSVDDATDALMSRPIRAEAD
jgi:glycerol-3-phosphate dehydrogenase (NAD(P)+)